MALGGADLITACTECLPEPPFFTEEKVLHPALSELQGQGTMAVVRGLSRQSGHLPDASPVSWASQVATMPGSTQQH